MGKEVGSELGTSYPFFITRGRLCSAGGLCHKSACKSLAAVNKRRERITTSTGKCLIFYQLIFPKTRFRTCMGYELLFWEQVGREGGVNLVLCVLCDVEVWEKGREMTSGADLNHPRNEMNRSSLHPQFLFTRNPSSFLELCHHAEKISMQARLLYSLCFLVFFEYKKGRSRNNLI